jgi:hypothetical protein
MADGRWQMADDAWVALNDMVADGRWQGGRWQVTSSGILKSVFTLTIKTNNTACTWRQRSGGTQGTTGQLQWLL